MNRALCFVTLCAPLAAQTSFSATRHAGLPSPITGVMFARGDIDGDGDQDLVVANDFAPIQVLINDGNGRFSDGTAGRLVNTALLDNHQNDLVDIDGDGDLDLLVANEDFVSNRVYVNDGTGVFTDVTATALPANAFDTKNQVIADFDGDGDPDWLTLDFGGSHYYANDGTGVFTDVTATRLSGLAQNLGYEWVMVPPATDLDGDGDLDVLVPGTSGGMLQNQGGVLSPFPFQLPATASTAHWLADVDGDGDVDVFASAGRRLFANQGNATFVEVTATAFASTPALGYAAFDVDRDGDIDVFSSNGLWLNDGSGVFTFAPAPLSTPIGFYVANAVADYDGDGDLELPGLPNLLHHVLAPTAPAIGGSYSVVLRTRPGVPSLAAVFGALGSGTTSLGPWGTLRLDPASAAIVGVQFSTAPPTTLTWQVPNVPAFVGTALHYQAIVDDPLLGLVVSNTFRDVVQ